MNNKDLKFFRNANTMNGLVKFIGELRACRARELEEKRVNKELANIRLKFKDPNLNGYQRKKYVCKLLYMYILGFDVDFGHVEAVSLIGSSVYSEKQIGYLSATIMLTENHDLIRLVVNSISKDLEDHSEPINCLALHAIANIGGREMSESLAHVIYRTFVGGEKSPFVLKKAALCLLRIFRKFPELIDAETWAPKIVETLKSSNLSVLNASVNLIIALCQSYQKAYTGAIPLSIRILKALVLTREFPNEYQYYRISSPWLQIKILRMLQYFPPVEDSQDLLKILNHILAESNEIPKNNQEANARRAILFEAISLIIHIDSGSNLIKQSIALLGSFLTAKESNIRYLALETMTHLAALGSLDDLRPHQQKVIDSLKDKDISVRRRALDLLFSMCDVSNAKEVVGELLSYLATADYEIRDEMVLKIAILAEKFASDYTWYVDVILKLVAISGDHVNDAIWHRVVQVVTNHDDLREYATYTVLQTVKNPAAHETAVKVAGYLLGEFGHVIVDSPGCSPLEQFMALHGKFPSASPSTRSLLLSTYFKFVNLFPEIKGEVMRVFKTFQFALDPELQQRACEYLSVISLPTEQLLEAICEEMPKFPERRSALVDQLQKKTEDTEDARIWTIGGRDAQIDLNRRNSMNRKDAVGAAETTKSAMKTAIEKVEAKRPDPILEDLLSIEESHPIPQGNTSFSNSPMTEHVILSEGERDVFFKKLLTTPSGVLYEDSIVQIGIKTEYHAHMGRIAIFFGNKSTSISLSHFKTDVSADPSLSVSLTHPISETIPPATQFHQLYNAECVGVINNPAGLIVSFTLGNQSTPTIIPLRLPIVLHKFMMPVEMSASDFFGRWNQIGGAPREVKSVFRTEKEMSRTELQERVKGLNVACLDGVDPNPNNVVAASILSSSNLGKIGCLMRIELNQEHQMCRLTVRTTSEDVSARLLILVQDVLSAA